MNKFFENGAGVLQTIKAGVLWLKSTNPAFQNARRFRPNMLVLGLLMWTLGVLMLANPTFPKMLSPLGRSAYDVKPLTQSKSDHEVFGFAPHWTFNKLHNVDFNVLTTLAYFDVGINSDGSLDRSGAGYKTFKSDAATELFAKAHDHGTRVVLTLTLMDTGNIETFLSSTEAQDRAIEEAVVEVKERGIDGVNIDVEYFGSKGPQYRSDFTRFATRMTERMHQEVPNSKVSVSVYASAVKEPRIYDMEGLGKGVDLVFMMAYDFAVKGADQAMPTSPLYGHKDGTYWYDVSTAVDDFLTKMPAEKLVLGLPWYGYDYPVYTPGVKADTHKGYYVTSTVRTKYGKRNVKKLVKPSSHAQTAARAREEIKPTTPGYSTGWDDKGQVGYLAYKEGSTWRMVFQEDTRSLSVKYDFAKDKNLKGVGMWALGFEDDSGEFWQLLEDKFGTKHADSSIGQRDL